MEGVAITGPRKEVGNRRFVHNYLSTRERTLRKMLLSGLRNWILGFFKSCHLPLSLAFWPWDLKSVPFPWLAVPGPHIQA